MGSAYIKNIIFYLSFFWWGRREKELGKMKKKKKKTLPGEPCRCRTSTLQFLKKNSLLESFVETSLLSFIADIIIDEKL